MIVALSVTLILLFAAVNIQFYRTWSNYNHYLGERSPTQSWINRKQLSFSLEVFDMLVGIKRLEVACLRYAVGNISDLELMVQTQQVSGMIVHFNPAQLIGRELQQHQSYDPAIRSIRALIEGAEGLKVGTVGIDAVIELAEQTAGDWMLLNNDTIGLEYALRDEMERTILAFRPLAQQALWIIGVLSVLCVIALIAAIYVGARQMLTERRRFERFELMIASIGHDLRSPLQTIQSAGSLLARNNDQASRERYASMVKVATRSLSRLVGDVLQIVRKERLSIELQRVDMQQWCSEFLPIYRAKATVKGLELLEQITLPARYLQLDPERLSQCVGNLLDNAIHYTPTGHVDLYMGLLEGADHSDLKTLEIKVSDTGRGIAKEDQKRVFEPFERSVDTGAHHGMGLGLSIVTNLVESAGGYIDLHSKEGVGSTFTLSCPVQVLEPTGAGGGQVGVSVGDKDMAAVDTEILVVDDDAAICASVAELLREAGFSVDTANDGMAGLQKVKHGHYKVVLTDIQMPAMDGFELATRCKELPKTTPFLVAMTAYSEKLGLDPRSKVFDSVLCKVFSEEDLLRVIDMAMC